MNCKFCNAELSEEVTLCPACGKDNAEEITEEVAVTEMEEVIEEVAEVAEETAEVAAVEEANEEPVAVPRKKRSLWVTILAVVGGIALLAVLVGAVIYGTKSLGAKTVSYSVSDAKAEQAKSTVVATAGAETLTNSELQVYYWQGINDFYNYMSYYMDPSTMGLDLSQPLDQQMYSEEEGITWQQYFLDAAIETWYRYAALSNVAKDEGVQLSADNQALLESIPEQMDALAIGYGYESAEQMLHEDMGAACDMDGYMRFLTTNYYVTQFMDSKYAQMTPTMDELEAYYAENEEELMAMGIENDGSRYVNVRHILFVPESDTMDETTGEMVYTEEDWEDCRVQAQTLLDQWLHDGATEEHFAELAMEYTQDPGSQSTGGLYTNVTLGQMVEPFEKWCFDESRKPGDSGLVKTDYGYHIMYFVDTLETWVSDLTTQMLTERSTAMVEEAIAKYPLETDLKKVVLTNTGVEQE